MGAGPRPGDFLVQRLECGAWRALAEICMVTMRKGELKESGRNAAGNTILKHITNKPTTASTSALRLGCLPVSSHYYYFKLCATGLLA